MRMIISERDSTRRRRWTRAGCSIIFSGRAARRVATSSQSGRTFVVLPYRGDLEPGKPGEYQGYTLRPGGEPLRNAIVELLVRDLGGERLAEDPGAFQRQVKVNGRTISVSVIVSAAEPR